MLVFIGLRFYWARDRGWGDKYDELSAAIFVNDESEG